MSQLISFLLITTFNPVLVIPKYIFSNSFLNETSRTLFELFFANSFSGLSVVNLIEPTIFLFFSNFYFLKNDKNVSLSTENWYNLAKINVGIPKYFDKAIKVYRSEYEKSYVQKVEKRG